MRTTEKNGLEGLPLVKHISNDDGLFSVLHAGSNKNTVG